jgi:hypothetical protein
MAFIRGPNIVRNGLVLYLDAANRKSCTGQPVTNLLTYTNTLTTNWSGYCGPTSNITYNTTDVTDPLGTNTAIKVVRGSNVTCNNTEAWGLLYSVYPSVILSSGKGYTVTVYARGASGGETIDFGLNDSHMTYSQTLTTTWTRYTYYISSVSDTSRGMQFRNTTGNCTYYIWGPQVVLGTVAGDYVASVGATNGTKNLTFRDLSGNNNNGTFTNAPVFGSSNLGVITFDGVDDYVINSSIPNPPTTTLSFVVWATFSDPTSDRFLLCIGRDIGGPTGGLALLAYGFNVVSDELVFEFGSGYGRVSSGIVPSTNTWYHIGVTADGTNVKIYINGVLKNTASQSTGAVASSPKFSLGSNIDGSANPGPYYHSGNIANFQLYNRALSASEVLQNFNATRTRFGI